MTHKEKLQSPTSEKETSKENMAELINERHESMRDKLEKAELEHKEKKASEKEVLAEAKKLADKQDEKEPDAPVSPAERRRGPITKKQLDQSFTSQMDEARTHMGPGSRAFSKLIHSRPVEVTSDIIASTIARPNALLSGSIAAFATITILFFVAKHYGFQLSGFETIGAFILGWLAGILYDYVSVMIRGRER